MIGEKLELRKRLSDAEEQKQKCECGHIFHDGDCAPSAWNCPCQVYRPRGWWEAEETG